MPQSGLLDADYAVHALATRSVRAQIGAAVGGSTTAKNISQARIRRLDIALPTPDVQRSVAALLNSALAVVESHRESAERLAAARLATLRALVAGAARAEHLEAGALALAGAQGITS